MIDPSSIPAFLMSIFFQIYHPHLSKSLNGFPVTWFRSLSLRRLRQNTQDVWPWSWALLSVITTARLGLFFTGSISTSQDIVTFSQKIRQRIFQMLTNSTPVIVEDPAKKICTALLLVDSIGSVGPLVNKCVTCLCTAVLHYRWLKIHSHQW